MGGRPRGPNIGCPCRVPGPSDAVPSVLVMVFAQTLGIEFEHHLQHWEV